jgi:hypothetical protein
MMRLLRSHPPGRHFWRPQRSKLPSIVIAFLAVVKPQVGTPRRRLPKITLLGRAIGVRVHGQSGYAGISDSFPMSSL